MPINANLKLDLYNDTTFQNAGIYDDSKRFEKFDVMRWLDVKFPMSAQVYREDVDGTENKDGVVHVPVMTGKGAFEIFHWGTVGGPSPKGGKDNALIKNAFGVQVNVIGGHDDPDFYNPFGAKWLITWLANYAVMPKRATAGIGCMCGATALPSIV